MIAVHDDVMCLVVREHAELVSVQPVDHLHSYKQLIMSLMTLPKSKYGYGR